MDYADKAAAVETRDRNISLAALKRRAAIKRLKGGSLSCMSCGEEIPEKRRKAMPYCEYCLPCQAQREE